MPLEKYDPREYNGRDKAEVEMRMFDDADRQRRINQYAVYMTNAPALVAPEENDDNMDAM